VGESQRAQREYLRDASDDGNWLSRFVKKTAR
jgi:hypothetical protein